MAATAKLFVSSPPGYGSLADSSTAVNDDGGGVAGTELNVSLDPSAGGEIGTPNRSSVAFQDLTFCVKEWKLSSDKGKLPKLRREGKTILNGVSGILPPGLNAIMGPTGSGKTTLLDILADRKGSAGVSGVVLVNGERRPRNFKCVSGYVVQDDILMGTLSVRENLHFSAALRLPSNTTRQQRMERVERVIQELGLEQVSNSKIGTEFIRGISGGERKRTSIGMELIIEPQVLFLDEPTTGLDAYTAVAVLKLLKELSTDSDRMVILSIHQPRYSIFKLFDTLTLLSRGELVYHGSANMALGYFDHLGFPCEEHENPADYFLDVVNRCEKRAQLTEAQDDNLKLIDMVSAYQQSEDKQRAEEQVREITDQLGEKDTEGGFIKRTWGASYPTNPFRQWFFVTRRSAQNLIRNPQTSVFQLVATLMFAAMVVLIFFRITDRSDNRQGVQTSFSDRFGAFFFMAINQVFLNLTALDIFIRQKPLFIHESVSGYYRVSAYFFAKVCTDIIPMRLVPLLFYTTIGYFGVGFQEDAGNFFTFVLILSLTSLSASAIVFAVSARVQVLFIALLIVALSFILSLLFGGLFIALDSLPIWVQWMKWLSIFRYGVEALAINEFSGQFCYGYLPTVINSSRIYQCASSLPRQLMNVSCDCGETSGCCSGDLFLEMRGYETANERIWYDVLALVGFFTLFMALAYVSLRLVKKEK